MAPSLDPHKVQVNAKVPSPFTPKPRMRIRTVHKWIGIAVGLVLLMWSVTGIIMILPGRPSEDAGAPIDLARATIPPAAALAGLTGRDPARAVRSLALIPILDRLVYQIEAGRKTYLIDASSGERVEITAETAREIAVRKFRGTPGQIQVERLVAHDAGYAAGTLPVYRVQMGDSRSTVSYVSERDGSVVTRDSRRQLRLTAGRLHDFSIIRLVGRADWFHRSLAVGAGLIVIGSILTGYWLAIPVRARMTRRRVTEPMSRREK